jgi:outer membrane protein TolC
LADTTASGGRKSAPEGRSRQFSFEVPIPLFDWNQAGIRRANAELLAARAEEERTRRAVLASATLAWERYQAAALKWGRFAKSLAAMAKKNQRSASRLFAAGEIDYEDLLMTGRDLNRVQVNEVDAWRDLTTAAWTLACALGQHDPSPRTPGPGAK